MPATATREKSRCGANADSAGGGGCRRSRADRKRAENRECDGCTRTGRLADGQSTNRCAHDTAQPCRQYHSSWRSRPEDRYLETAGAVHKHGNGDAHGDREQPHRAVPRRTQAREMGTECSCASVMQASRCQAALDAVLHSGTAPAAPVGTTRDDVTRRVDRVCIGASARTTHSFMECSLASEFSQGAAEPHSQTPCGIFPPGLGTMQDGEPV